MDKIDKIDILGSKISVWDLPETAVKLRELAQAGGKHYVCISNVHTVVTGAQDPAYAAVTNGATLATADGVPLVWASRLLGGPKIHGRASGPDILPLILRDPAAGKLRHFFFGSTPEVLQALRENLGRLAPAAELVGFYSPPFRPMVPPHEPLSALEHQECRMIDDFKPDIVWVGLGAPKQEVWMHRARAHLNAPVLVGAGAAFDFLAGLKKRAPAWMQRAGLEWLHRLSQEPRRLFSRYLKTNPLFVFGVIRQALRRIR